VKRGALSILAVAVAAAVVAANLARPASRAEAVRAGGVNTAPSMRPWRYAGADTDSWWCKRDACNGVSNGTVFVDRELPLAAELGARTLRIELPWALIEPRRGRFDWARFDYIVRAARRLKVTLQPIIVFTPAWAGKDTNSPPSAAAFSKFAGTLAHRYRGRVRYYELWNEPDLSRYWAGTVQQYVQRVLKPGYAAIKRADRRARVLLGGPSRADANWFENVYRYGGGRSFDIAAYHVYSGAAEVINGASVMSTVLKRHRQGAKPIWLGEYGTTEAGPQAPQQDGLIRAVLTQPAPLAMAQWYTLRDTQATTCCPANVIESDPWGLVTRKYERKSSFALMRTLLKGG
jgi:Cellulase (glycosyl hydrolase family 5)